MTDANLQREQANRKRGRLHGGDLRAECQAVPAEYEPHHQRLQHVDRGRNAHY